jgi:hypothetical protein
MSLEQIDGFLDEHSDPANNSFEKKHVFEVLVPKAVELLLKKNFMASSVHIIRRVQEFFRRVLDLVIEEYTVPCDTPL